MTKRKKMLRAISLFLILLSGKVLISQSFYFGPAIGPGINFQRWDQSDRDPLLSINAEVFVESVAEETKSAFFASLGYKTRGSSTIFSNATGGININSYKYKFNNAVLELGAKRYLSEEVSRAYYMVGIRGEYNLSTNLDEYKRFGSPYFPLDTFTNKFIYGFSFGGGYEFSFNEFLNGFVQISVCPDINLQYHQPPLGNVITPGQIGGSTTFIDERRVKNTSIEIKFGLKILRKVIYE